MREMTRLTAQEIKNMRSYDPNVEGPLTPTGLRIWQAICDLALTARSEGFREGVEAAAMVCKKAADDLYEFAEEQRKVGQARVAADNESKAATAKVLENHIRALSPRETDAKTEGEPFPVELMSHSMDDDKRLMARKILKLQRIEKAYCAANDYINALTGTASIPPESLKKIEAAYWQAVKEVQ